MAQPPEPEAPMRSYDVMVLVPERRRLVARSLQGAERLARGIAERSNYTTTIVSIEAVPEDQDDYFQGRRG